MVSQVPAVGSTVIDNLQEYPFGGLPAGRVIPPEHLLSLLVLSACSFATGVRLSALFFAVHIKAVCRYAPFYSARIEVHARSLKDAKAGSLHLQMVQNLLRPLQEAGTNIVRFEVHFHIQVSCV